MTTDQSPASPFSPDAELRRRVDDLCTILGQIDELQVQAKQIKAEAKQDGYDMKAFAQIVKECRRGADYQVAQLELELIVDTYRHAANLPVTLEAAQEAARAAAEELPETVTEDRPARQRTGRMLEAVE
ncbi:MAG: GapR family DNA-binding domain-containing protein [Hyphomicrobiaceae bacterium]